MQSVFIIEDDLIHQRIAQIIIEKNNLFEKVSCYTFAGDALDFLFSNKDNPEALPDVILLDLNMPVISGWDFLHTYVQLQKDLQKVSDVYIVSSSVDENDKLHSRQYPFVKGFMSKPISPDLLNSHFQEKPLAS
ncbi:MAG: response regulator receiver protein [Sphingobacteriaceae bacterium]|jgi:CheY-like chemotaxis protein|nr:response regulator receiver protein [Sphingobacteriaceae bacterium]